MATCRVRTIVARLSPLQLQLPMERERCGNRPVWTASTASLASVNKALQETAARLRRLEAMRKLTDMGTRGDFDKGISAYEARKEAWRE